MKGKVYWIPPFRIISINMSFTHFHVWPPLYVKAERHDRCTDGKFLYMTISILFVGIDMYVKLDKWFKRR